MNEVSIGIIGLGAIFLTLWLIELTSRIKAGRQLRERDSFYREEIRRLSHENKSLVTRIKSHPPHRFPGAKQMTGSGIF